VAILCGTAVMCLCMGWYSVRFYPIRYDWGRLALLLGAGLAFAVWHDELLLWLAGFGISGLFAIVVKLLIVLLYLALGTLIFRNEASAVARMARRKLRSAGGSGSR
jgi:hypothetical protein